MCSLILAAALLVTSSFTEGYWDPERQEVENPRNEGTACDQYCRLLLPSYINWREHIRGVEFDGLDTVVRYTVHGTIKGLSVPGVHDTNSFVSMFLGIPYAKPPVHEDSFKPAQEFEPPWDGVRDCTYYRPACPQIEDFISEDIPGFSYINEDCLHLNVFQPNRTDERNKLNTYPVMIFIHGGGWKKGSALQYPGLILAQRDMVVVTLNYRLGPLGFLSTGDSRIPGNMGLSDQEMAIRWVKKNIARFSGDPERITLVGHEAGAASVGIHMLSPRTRDLFSRAIMMSGSDLSPWAVMTLDPCSVQTPCRPEGEIYECGVGGHARKLSEIVGCSDRSGEDMVKCLRNKHPMELVNAAEKVQLGPGETAGPFAPVVDNFTSEGSWLSDFPFELRKNPDNVKQMDLLLGFSKDDGSWKLAQDFSDVFSDITAGVNEEEYNQVIRNVTLRRGACDVTRVMDTIEFLYTWQADPNNDTVRRTMLIEVFTDELYASGIDQVAKSHIKSLQNSGKNVYLYKFNYRSELHDRRNKWMGASFNSDVKYLFGWPYLAINRTYQYLAGIRLESNYTKLDRNISNGTMRMWKDFAYFGNPTQYELNLDIPWNFQNLTWYPMNISNLTYFDMNRKSVNLKEYHQPQLAFWQYYIYDILFILQYTTTPYPMTTYDYSTYLEATYSLAAVLIVALLALGAILVALHRSRFLMGTKQEREAFF